MTRHWKKNEILSAVLFVRTRNKAARRGRSSSANFWSLGLHYSSLLSNRALELVCVSHMSFPGVLKILYWVLLLLVPPLKRRLSYSSGTVPVEEHDVVPKVYSATRLLCGLWLAEDARCKLDEWDRTEKILFLSTQIHSLRMAGGCFGSAVPHFNNTYSWTCVWSWNVLSIYLSHFNTIINFVGL
jgi:hypothetical protein